MDRHQIALKAMEVLLKYSLEHNEDVSAKEIAQNAYKVADAMCEEGVSWAAADEEVKMQRMMGILPPAAF